MGISQKSGMLQTKLGAVHYQVHSPSKSSSELAPVLAFHMSPRSTDEYAEAAPLISATGRLMVAIDELGYGRSSNPVRSCSIDEIADCGLAVADELGLKRFVAAGSLLGCLVSISLASRYPERVCGTVLTNLYHYRAKAEEASSSAESVGAEGTPIPDPWTLSADGEHLIDLWKRRSSWLDDELNTRAVSDELTYLLNRRRRYQQGIRIQDASAFDFEAAARAVRCPVLCLRGEGAASVLDKFGLDFSGQFDKGVEMLADADVALVSPGSINLINQDAEKWAAHVQAFLDAKVDNGGSADAARA